MSLPSTQSYLDELNEIQRKAVEATEGPVMVIAGPGSGKTRVLTYRIAHLIKKGVAPWNILALTFTNKAARSMKDRIEQVVGSSANRMWAGTFHSIFARILRVEAHHIGYPNDFSIYDTDDSKSLINEIIKSLNLNSKSYPNGMVRSRISSAKSNLITPKMYAVNEDLMSQDRMSNRPMLQVIYDKYVKKCQQAGAMDFDDLLLMMFKVLYKHPEIRAKYQKQFKYLLVDEFQDTNYLQFEIVKLLTQFEGSAENICIVGDDAQSIYSFRGATIENILQFQNDYKNVQVYKLEQNYRSTNYIVEAANQVITQNKRQIQKKIWTEKDGGEKIKLIKAMTDTDEGKRVADTIVEHKNRFGLANKDIAILYRTNSQSRIFEEFLRRYNLPYRIFGGTSFYQRKEIKDLIAYFRLSVNSKDNEAFKRVINFPKRGIGKTTVEQLIQLADDNEMSIVEALKAIEFKGRARQKLHDFVKMIKSFQTKVLTDNAYDAACHIARKCGITELYKNEGSMESMNRLENINSLLDGIQEFVEDDLVEDGEEYNTDRSLAKYLQGISLMTDQDNEGTDNDSITLMSVHAAKGLEYRQVFVVGLEENLFPSYLSLSDPNQLDEERRLFYVAITRAEEFLCLSSANTRYQYGSVRNNESSRFIEEIPEDNYDAVITMRNADRFTTPKKLGGIRAPKIQKKLDYIDPDNFNPVPSHTLKKGMKVLHLRFGKGNILSIDDSKIATIEFYDLVENQQKRIALRYAKLEVIEE